MDAKRRLRARRRNRGVQPSLTARAFFRSNAPFWFKISDDGTTVHFYESNEGVVWDQLYSVAKASGFLGTSGYNQIGLDVNGEAGWMACTLLSYKETSP